MSVRHVTTLVGMALLLSGCAQHYYYSKPAATADAFTADHRACVRAVGIPNTAGTHALVSPSLYRSCMADRGWLYAKQTEPAGPEWFRGVEREEVIALEGAAPERPRSFLERTPVQQEAYCRERHLVPWQSIKIPAYNACLAEPRY
jgi:hypothetical protein